jgi:hypothetical protein
MDDLKKKSLVLAVVIALIMVVAVGGAIAVYSMTAPNSDPVTFDPVVEPTATPTPTPSPTQAPQIATLSKVTLSTYHTTAGQPVTMSTTVSDSTPNLDVNFFASDGTLMGTVKSDVAGLASLTTTVNSAWTGTFYATAQHP